MMKFTEDKIYQDGRIIIQIKPNFDIHSSIYYICFIAQSSFMDSIVNSFQENVLASRNLAQLSDFALQMKYFHKILMPYVWTVGVDIAVMLALFKHKRYAIVLHSICALAIAVITMSTALSILIPTGFLKEEDRKFNQRHQIMGVITLAIMLIQITSGIASRILQLYTEKKSTVIYKLNFIHKYIAYPLIILGKVQSYLKMYNKPFFVPILIADVALTLIFLFFKFKKTTISSKIVPHNVATDCRSIKSLEELKSAYKNICIFANYVYDLTPMRLFHPIGHKIIESINDREVDRYMYGMYRSQREPQIPTNNHGHKAFSLLGKPIAKLDINPVYTGIQADFVDVALSRVQEVSAKGNIYEIELVSKGPQEIEFKGYESVDQLGRFFSLTIDKKVTRLFTTVGFLTDSNVTLLREEYFNDLETDFDGLNTSISTDSTMSAPMISDDGERRTLKLLIKKYHEGKLSKKIVEEKYKDLKLSTSRGEGLRFGELKPGKIIIVAGGTGLFPFCDLIDLLFKNLLVQKLPKLKRAVFENDPVLRMNPFDNFTFELFLSVNNIEDIHPLTLAQLNELAATSSFTLNLRISKDKDKIMNLSKAVRIHSQRFTGTISQLCQQQQFQKLWVCGPPAMNDELVPLFDKLNLPSSKYLIL